MSLLFGIEEDNEKQTIKEDNSKKNENKTSKTTDKKIKEPKVKIIDEEQTKNDKIIREIKKIECFEKIGEQIINQFSQNKLHHSTMFSGNYGIGKATFAYWLICEMILKNCKNEEEVEFQTDLLKRNVHQDVLFLQSKNGDDISVDEVRNLLERVNMKSTYGNKFILIDDINSLNASGVNALLKTLEEPTPNTYFFIINQKTRPILDTIYSRCNEIKLNITRKDCVKYLTTKYEDYTSNEIDFYTDISENSISIAEMLIEDHILTITENVDIQNIKQTLNNVYDVINSQHKNLTNNLKLNILEKIMLFLLKKIMISQNNNNDNDDIAKNINISNSLTKQFLNFKRFDIPTKFL